MSLLLPIIAVLVGFILLTVSADRLILVSSTLAKQFGVSVMFIGMTVIAFGTSFPELVVSAIASFNGAEGLAVGNAIGSNIINCGLVLALCALFMPLVIQVRFIKRELPILVVALIAVIALMSNGSITMWDSLILILLLALYCVYLAKSSSDEDVENELEFLDVSQNRALVETIAMLFMLLISSQIMVWGSVQLAQAMGVSDLLIGLTIVAFGTSLPELAAAIAGVRRGMPEIAFATVIGSNTFNLLGVLAFPGLIGDGLQLPAEVLTRDIPMLSIMTAFMVISFTMTYIAVTKRRSALTPEQQTDEAIAADSKLNYRFGRLSGAVLLIMFIGYSWVLFTA
ncbi:Inner membrane protein YrbG, putative calcium/sodium:proton antiporter [Moritella sp. JT01]|uniref:calcium/sodium antiporter n=1 Tax=Moritella sp. JT01 TaxID=756698 RepID=UPI0007952A47|nr:calcium/sodium antiporter [Moritella sp. JT01]KXO12776.1 Inner membrane protein YrbG, putative calcium/sodium:proton antiporter [Moritella sp. JT01]